MKLEPLLCVLVACAAPKPLVTPSCPPATPSSVSHAEPAPLPDEASIKEKSRRFFDAFDRASVDEVQDMLAPSFVWYEEQRSSDRDMMLGNFKRRAERHAPIHSRTWNDERVTIGPTSAVYIGDATEHMPADGDVAALDEEGSSTLVWVRDGARWTIALWQWEPAGIVAEQGRWNRWLTAGRGFNHKPNQTLVDAVKGRKPGTALDIAMGQGRNAIFLAAAGWKVTGVDIADQGIAMAKDEAAKLKVKLDTVQSDIDKYDLGKDKWDLVTMIYAGDDIKLVERIKPAVKKGGLFVTEYFANDSEIAKSGAGGWDDKALAAAFKDGWKILRDDHVDDNADWASQRKTKLVRFVAQKL
jgi:SAM-dependent methyltransferase